MLTVLRYRDCPTQALRASQPKNSRRQNRSASLTTAVTFRACYLQACVLKNLERWYSTRPLLPGTNKGPSPLCVSSVLFLTQVTYLRPLVLRLHPWRCTVMHRVFAILAALTCASTFNSFPYEQLPVVPHPATRLVADR